MNTARLLITIFSRTPSPHSHIIVLPLQSSTRSCSNYRACICVCRFSQYFSPATPARYLVSQTPTTSNALTAHARFTSAATSIRPRHPFLPP
jgi:hypothetical protein